MAEAASDQDFSEEVDEDSLLKLVEEQEEEVAEAAAASIMSSLQSFDGAISRVEKILEIAKNNETPLGIVAIDVAEEGTALAMPTKANCSWCWSGPRSRSTPTDRRTMSAARSPSERSAAAQEATPVATAATPSSASPRPVQSSGSHSGIILAHGSQCQTAPKSLTCPHWSASA
jgi:hypothetical protein